ncbi:hypothetical protein QD336_12980 [Rhizobium sp. BR 250]
MNEHLRGSRAVLPGFEARPGLGKLAEGWKDRLVYLVVDAEEQLGLSAVSSWPGAS